MRNIVVTGGAGYIGSHVVKALLADPKNHVVVIDNLSTGFVENVGAATFIQGDIQNTQLLATIFAKEKINVVMHFAASTVLSESIQFPLRYYQNNVLGTLSLLQVCQDHPIEHFILSSSAAVYGATEVEHIHEDHPTLPLNPYAASKLMSEQIVTDVAQSLGFTYAILRYFNVAGADPDGKLGQRTPQATHLIKNAVQTACGLHSALPIYGNDYATPDGTCIRDYIHVNDLASAHLKALDYLTASGRSVTLNCGYGHGFSVIEVIKAIEQLTGRSLPIKQAPRRQGDLAQVIADNTRIKSILDWQPQFNDLAFIVKTALDFEVKIRSIS
jgi:UDP-glucose 4-epimerase